MVECRDGTLYTGMAADPEKRAAAHNAGKGAKYTKTRLPVRLVYREELATKSDALRREYQLKQLTRRKKLELVENYRKNSEENVKRI